MKIISINLPKKNKQVIREKRGISPSVIYSAIVVILIFLIIGLIYILLNSNRASYNTGEINYATVEPSFSATPTLTQNISPTLSISPTRIAQTTVVPTVISFGQIKTLIDKTKDETAWVSPSIATFSWVESCSDQTKQTSNINGSITQTTIDFTKSTASKIEQDIQEYFQSLDWKQDSCNSTSTSTKQIRAYRNSGSNKRVVVTYDSVYKDSPDPNYPPSGKKVSETVTVQYE